MAEMAITQARSHSRNEGQSQRMLRDFTEWCLVVKTVSLAT